MLILFLSIIVLGVFLASKTAKNEPKVCKPHKWVLRDVPDSKMGYLICKVCGKLPGDA